MKTLSLVIILLAMGGAGADWTYGTVKAAKAGKTESGVACVSGVIVEHREGAEPKGPEYQFACEDFVTQLPVYRVKGGTVHFKVHQGRATAIVPHVLRPRRESR